MFMFVQKTDISIGRLCVTVGLPRVTCMDSQKKKKKDVYRF